MFLEQEARALLTRLARVKPFALHDDDRFLRRQCRPVAQTAIERYLAKRAACICDEPHTRGLSGVAVRTSDGQRAAPADAQRRFTFLRHAVQRQCSRSSTFSRMRSTQRSEHENGVWLVRSRRRWRPMRSTLPGYYEAPPVVCYLDRGMALPSGAPARACQAAARIRWRLSACHANGWSAAASPLRWYMRWVTRRAALLDLVNSLRPVLQGMQQKGGQEQMAWQSLGALDLGDCRRLLVRG